MNTRSFMPASRGQLAKYRSEISVVGGERERWEGGGDMQLAVEERIVVVWFRMVMWY